MQDANADLSILIHIRMEYRCFEFQFRWVVWVIGWESHSSAETASAVEGVLFVGEHEHDFPFEDVGVYETDAYAGDVFICLHLFVLLAEDECCAGGAARRSGVASIGGRSHGGVEGGGVARRMGYGTDRSRAACMDRVKELESNAKRKFHAYCLLGYESQQVCEKCRRKDAVTCQLGEALPKRWRIAR